MSINDFWDKIKGRFYFDSTTWYFILIVLFTSLASFGLGRLSVSNNPKENSIKLDNTNLGLVKEETGESQMLEKDLINTPDLEKKRMYVASKNGKLYYSLGCSGAKRISPKNEIWFANKIEAEKSGYTLSTSCK